MTGKPSVNMRGTENFDLVLTVGALQKIIFSYCLLDISVITLRFPNYKGNLQSFLREKTFTVVHQCSGL